MKNKRIIILLIFICVAFCSCGRETGDAVNNTKKTNTTVSSSVSSAPARTTAVSMKGTLPDEKDDGDLLSKYGIPAFSGDAYYAVNGNFPFFTSDDMKKQPFEYYSDLDDLGRCGPAFACIDASLMPTEKRGSISSVKPTGWRSVRYDFVEEHSLYNRSHLIGYQLTAENANKQNLVTGTRFMNACGMTLFEDMTADYIKETGNRVLYRVTPVFVGDELICRGVLMEARSVEDIGSGICFNVFVYNVQPYIDIDYGDGSSRISDAYYLLPGLDDTYTVNKNTRKIHLPECELTSQIKNDNKETICCPIDALIAQGYTKCKNCLDRK